MEALGYYRADVHSLFLDELETVLEQSIAAVYWRGKCGELNFIL